MTDDPMTDANPARPLSPAQFEIMEQVWDRPGSSVTEIWSALREDRPIARNTVLTQIQRLETAGWLARTDAGRGHVYTATVGRADARRRHVEEVVDHAFGGSAENLVLSLLGSEMIDGDALGRLREALDEAEGSQGKGKATGQGKATGKGRRGKKS